MSVREALLALALIAATALIVRGVAVWSHGAALIVAGVLVAALAALFLVEAD